MIELAPGQIAEAIGADVVREGDPGRPTRASIDSRGVVPGDLFFGLRGSRVDGGEHAAAALSEGAWGAVVERSHADGLTGTGPSGWVFGVDDALVALQALATAWRRELGCSVVGITGSTGKTSVKDIVRALLPRRVHASRENMNTEIGLPLTILEAEPETEVLVLEMGMRGRGQIAELCAIAEPDVGAITNIGPVHLELLGTIEAVAETKAELLAGLPPTGRAVVPEGEESLAPHLDDALVTITFGPGGEVFARDWRRTPTGIEADVATPHGEEPFAFPFPERHNLTNALCAVAIGVALDLPVAEMARRAPGISFSRLRGELISLPGDAVLINDCYNANPVSMQAALEHLGSLDVTGRRIAVLGDMAELGPDAGSYHGEAGAQARAAGVDVLVGVGELARDYAPDEWVANPEGAVEVVEPLVGDGDAILVKGSRAVGLERVAEKLTEVG